MGIFTLIVVIPLIVLYGLAGIVTLKALNVPLTLSLLVIFTVCGTIAGASAMVLYGVIVADQNGNLNSNIEIIGMFIVAGVVGFSASVFSVKAMTNHEKRKTLGEL